MAHVYDWARLRSLDLDERLESGNGLSPDEIMLLYQNLRYRRPFARDVAAKRLTEIEEPDVVAMDVHRSRVYFARDYLTCKGGRESTSHPRHQGQGDPRADHATGSHNRATTRANPGYDELSASTNTMWIAWVCGQRICGGLSIGATAPRYELRVRKILATVNAKIRDAVAGGS